MKTINKKRNSHKSLVITGIIVLFLAAFAVYVFVFNGSFFGYSIRPQTDNTINLDTPSETEIIDGNKTKSNSVDNKTTGDSDKPSTPTETDTASGKLIVTTDISAQNQTDTTLQLRFIIGTVTSSGSCTLTFTKGSTIVTKTATIQALASTSTCKGFDVPLTELSTGTWKIALQFSNDTYTGSTTGEVIIK